MEYVSGNIFIRPNVLTKAGDAVDGHCHNFDHTTFVFTGAVLVEAKLPDGLLIKRVFRSPSCVDDVADGVTEGGHHFLVKAEVLHKITALVDNTVFDCVYSHRTPQGDIVQEWTGWREATV